MKSITPREVARRLSSEKEILIVSHESPDGDALGCVTALGLMARNLRIPFRMYIPGEGSFPPEYSFLPLLSDIERGGFPEVTRETTAYLLDCATAERIDPTGLACAGDCINIDHHQDNRGYGTLNLLDFGATSTTQILFDVFVAGGLPVDSEIATSLYVGLVTDSGRFQYSNTTPAAHRMAADLLLAGVDANAVSRGLFETMPLAKILLQARALGRLEMRLGGRLVISRVDADDFADSGASEGLTEGIIDGLRRIEGVAVAAFLRERTVAGVVSQKVSLRSTDGRIDVAEVAHLRGGGGHVRAAGFTVEGEARGVMDWIEREVGARL
ncbi:MAG TPA: bifunctional oligoribonuclease/PAP phosphatase NrnA [Thermoleophilia bacterium]|nr:bifunctional oligoribonuclease/PAP phosphatase NrnA [Thermoleophilia bacterium]